MGAAAGPERAGAAGTDGEGAPRARGQPGRIGVSRWGAGVTRELSPGARAATRPGKARERELQKRGPPPAPAILFLPGPGSRAAKPRPPHALLLARLDQSSALGGCPWRTGSLLMGRSGGQ